MSNVKISNTSAFLTRDVPAVLTILGGQKTFSMEIEDSENLLDAITGGLTKENFDALLQYTGFTQKFLANLLEVAPRTIQIKEDKAKLETHASEKMVALADLFREGLNFYGGDKKKFQGWLAIPNPYLKTRTPLDYLKTTAGIQLVKDVFDQWKASLEVY
jgi:putative toxin-antitoxin system antitoxin component (TIGR02293 family)